MHAALVTTLGAPPRYEEVADPEPAEGEEVLEVLAAAVHPIVRARADGSHYTSTGELPLVPGLDGVGRRADGTLVYFIVPGSRSGSMAQRVAVDARRSVDLPAGTDPVMVAAAMNPAMSAWLALRRRTRPVPGQRVLVLGATGSAGRAAVQVARHLGASHVTAAGRDPGRLAALGALGADALVSLTGPGAAGDLAAVGADVDVVLDYLWGPPAALAMSAAVSARTDGDQDLTWVQIGSAAGEGCAVPAAALRSTRLRVVGSGQGSVPLRDIAAELPALAAHVSAGNVSVDARAVPLADVEAAWTAPDRGEERLVLLP